FLRIDGLAWAMLGDQAQQDCLDGAGVGTRWAFGLHVRAIAYSPRTHKSAQNFSHQVLAARGPILATQLKVGKFRNRLADWCPDSGVRIIVRRPRLRTSESTDTGSV